MIALIFIIGALAAGTLAFIQGKAAQTKVIGALGALMGGGAYLIPANIALSRGMGLTVQYGLGVGGFFVALWAYNLSKVDAMKAAIGED